MELFDGDRNSYEHYIQWYSTIMGVIIWDLKHSVLTFLERGNNICIKLIITCVCSTYLHKVIPGFLHCFLMEEEFLSSALKIQAEEYKTRKVWEQG